MSKLLLLLQTWWRMRYVDPIHKMAFYLVAAGIGLLSMSAVWVVLVSFESFPIDLEIGPRDSSIFGFFLLVLPGIGLAIWRQNQLSQTTTGILIFHRGMAGMDTSNPESVLPRSMRIGQLRTITIDNQSLQQDGRLVDPSVALRPVNSIDTQISSNLTDASSPSIAYAGLAPIPLLFAAGYRISSRQLSLILDYDRSNGWHLLDEEDDGEKILVNKPNGDCGEAKHCSIVLPLSVEISADQIPDNLKRCVYWIRLENGARADSLSSDAKQKRLAKEMYNVLAGIRAEFPALEVVHIFMACQASWAVRFGTMVTMSVHPTVAVYQFENGEYRWGVRIEPECDPEICEAPK